MSAPTISVIIPTHNRPARLGECLEALSRQDYPRGAFEVIVVDDGTPDRARVAAALEPFRASLDVQLLTQENAGPAKARNAGAAKAKFDYLAFTDDDCAPRPHWLSELAAAFEKLPDVVIGGSTVNGLSANPCSEASHRLVEYVVDYFLKKGTPFFPSSNLALSRASFEAVGGFDTSFPLAAGEDRDFCAKVRHLGIRLIAAPGAVVEHRHPLDLRGFLRQHFNYGRGAFVCRRLSGARDPRDMSIEPLRFYVDLVLLPFARHPAARGKLRLAALLFASQAANVAGFLGELLTGSRAVSRVDGD